MGSAASKEFKETEIAPVSVHEGDALCIHPSCVLAEPVTLKEATFKNEWADEAGQLQVQFKSKGLLKKCTSIVIGEEVVAYVVRQKRGFSTDVHLILHNKPAYDGQAALPAEDAKSMNAPEDMVLYVFGKMEVERKFMKATGVYSVATGDDQFKEVYTVMKLPTAAFKCIAKSGDTPVAKACQPGMRMSVQVEAAAGVDIAAVLLAGQSVASPDGTAGALAGAGVV